jgi:hypothetical protein
VWRGTMNEDAIKAYLYLHAVLPQLATIAASDEQARAALADRSASIQLRTIGGPCARLEVRRGNLAFARVPRPFPTLGLLLTSCSAAVRLFSGGTATPLPWWGVWRPSAIRLLRTLTQRLSFYLTASRADLEAAAAFPTAVGIRLSVLAYAIGVLTERWSEGRELAASAPAGTAVLRFAGGHPPGVRLVAVDGLMRASLEPAPVGPTSAPVGAKPNLIIEFADVDTAYGILSGELNVWVALGDARLKIRGLFPLADPILRIMGAVGRFLAI